MWIRRPPFLFFLVSGLALIPGSARAQGFVTPLGSPSVVNEYTTGDQSSPAVAGLEDRFAVVWRSPDGADLLGPGIFLRWVSAVTGEPLGQDVRISEAGATDVGPPELAAVPKGRLVVVWAEERDGSEALKAALFGPTFVNDEPITLAGPTHSVSSPVVAMDAAGRFAAMWVDGTSSTSQFVRGSLFGASGVLISSFFESPAGELGDPNDWDLALYPDGRIGVAISRMSDVDTFEIGLSFFDSDGQPAVPAGQQVMSSVSALLGRGRLIVEPDGSYWVLYTGSLGETIYGSRYNSDGSLVGHQEYDRPPVAVWVEGAASLTTHSVVVSTDNNAQIGYAQLDSSGALAHGLLANAGNQGSSARSTNGEVWLVVWQESNGDGDGLGIRSQRLEIPPFTDGFESGNVAAWSSSEGDGGP